MPLDEEKKQQDHNRYYPLLFTLLFVFIIFQYPFSSLESVLYDVRVKYDLKDESQNVIIVTLDDESDQFLGEFYPYSYRSHLLALNQLMKTNASFLAYDIDFQEPTTEKEQIGLLRFSDLLLSYIKSGGNIAFGTKFGPSTYSPFQSSNFPRFPSLVPKDDDYFAKDGVVRRLLLNKGGEKSLALHMANEHQRMQGKKPLEVKSILGSEYIREDDSTMALFRYKARPLEGESPFLTIPFHRIVVGNFPQEFFDNKMVIIGSQYITKTERDYLVTPFHKEEMAPRLNILAAQIMALINNNTIYMIPKHITYLFAVLIAIFLSITIARVNPTRGLIMALLVMFSIFFLGYFLFILFGIWVYLAHMILSVFVVYYILVPFRAIAEYQRRYAIQEETKMLKKVESLKQNFISLMSHDLKTPVAKIVGQADALIRLNNNRNPEMTKSINYIIESTKELNTFITSILDLTKIESRNISLDMSSKDINGILENVIKKLELQASLQKIGLKFESQPLFPIQVDVTLIIRVFSNLIENGIKYAGEGSTIIVKTWDDPSWVYIEISDNGVGIAEADLEYIFEKFYRVKNDTSHKVKGTGLGLYLVKYFVELHGGVISVSSQMGVGTIFLIKLKNG